MICCLSANNVIETYLLHLQYANNIFIYYIFLLNRRKWGNYEYQTGEYFMQKCTRDVEKRKETKTFENICSTNTVIEF